MVVTQPYSMSPMRTQSVTSLYEGQSRFTRVIKDTVKTLCSLWCDTCLFIIYVSRAQGSISDLCEAVSPHRGFISQVSWINKYYHIIHIHNHSDLIPINSQNIHIAIHMSETGHMNGGQHFGFEQQHPEQQGQYPSRPRSISLQVSWTS